MSKKSVFLRQMELSVSLPGVGVCFSLSVLMSKPN